MTTQITDHLERTLALRLAQFKDDKPRYAALLTAIANQYQELENALWQLLAERLLSVAVGLQLDLIGRVVGLERDGLWTDDQYRAYLGAQIAKNVSEGDPERLIQVLQLLTSSTIIRTMEVYPGWVEMNYDGEVPFSGGDSTLLTFLDDTALAGVRVRLIESDPDGAAFCFDGGDGLGMGDSGDAGVGGTFSAVVGE